MWTAGKAEKFHMRAREREELYRVEKEEKRKTSFWVRSWGNKMCSLLCLSAAYMRVGIPERGISLRLTA